MDFTCIRICEDGIVVTQNSEPVESSPGVGILRDNQVITGLEAAAQQFHLPQYTFKRFWKELNQKPLPNRNKNIRHNADLAYTHLKGLLQRVETTGLVVAAVPSEYSQMEVSTLAGIFESLNVPLTAIVDANVASLAAWAPKGEHFVLEMYPQHATISTLMVNSKVRLSKAEVLENLGWANLSQKIADYVAAQFLEQTRFSPFHEAENERSLNNQLDGIFHQAKTAKSFQISISHDGTPYTARLKSSEISEICVEALENIFSGINRSESNILLSEKVASLPGLEEVLNEFAVLDKSSFHKGIELNGVEFHNKNNPLYHIQTLSPLLDATDRPTSTTRNKDDTPNHLLTDSYAFPIGTFPTALTDISERGEATNGEAQAEVFLLAGKPTLRPKKERTTLNGETILSDVTLKTGDVIVTYPTGSRFRAIKVLKQSAS